MYVFHQLEPIAALLDRQKLNRQLLPVRARAWLLAYRKAPPSGVSIYEVTNHTRSLSAPLERFEVYSISMFAAKSRFFLTLSVILGWHVWPTAAPSHLLSPSDYTTWLIACHSFILPWLWLSRIPTPRRIYGTTDCLADRVDVIVCAPPGNGYLQYRGKYGCISEGTDENKNTGNR